MANKPDRIVLDTNILIYFLISDSFPKLEKRLKANKVKLLFSEELLQEFLLTVNRPKFKKYFTERELTILLENLHYYAELIEVNSTVSVCRDKKDNFLLALCSDGRANYLVTGDQDLLILKKFRKTSIVKIAEYLRLS
ncbi:MAG TPA: putative toxin-antitoxin system toxin component, PIN family [Bacteroidia bacterium]|nr:putative toxin-antitoxin system toxin component, PIN family [Bacteroidia bacterium]